MPSQKPSTHSDPYLAAMQELGKDVPGVEEMTEAQDGKLYL